MEPSVSARIHTHITDDVTREVLPNGLTVLVKENHNAPVVALLASVEVGYFNEPDRLTGIAHVIEHMLFKGTPRRAENEQIAREVRELGGVLNAGTYYEETYYYVVVPRRGLEAAMDIQADAFRHSQFDGEELSKEIEVIVQESEQKRDNPGAMLVESFYALAYDQHRLRRWRIGRPETLRSLTRDDLAAFYEATYRPENTTFAIVGDIETQEALALARRYWADLPRGGFQKELSPVEPARAGFRYQRLTGPTQQRFLLLGVPAPPVLHPDAVPLMVLSAILSDGRSARLYRRLKEEKRLVTSAWASYEGFEQMGLFTLGAECLSDDPLPVEAALWQEVERLRQTPIDAEELTRIKTRVATRRLYAQEEVLGVARTLASYEALGDYHLADTILERLHAVTAEDIQRVARRYLQLSAASLLEYLPTETPAPERATSQIESALRAVENPLSPGEERAPPPVPAAETRPASGVAVAGADATEAKAIPLPGGGALYFKTRRDLPIVAINVLFRGGRRQETPATSGLTNLMLKSAMKGTRTLTAEEIANRVEGLGSGIGMSLAPDYFGYGIKLRKDVLPEGFAIFADVIAHPSFPGAEVERERQSLFAELRRQQDNAFSLAYDLFSSACYGEQHPYGLPAIGLTEAIERFTREELVDWHARHVVAPNLAVGIVGDLTEAEALELVSGLLEKIGKAGTGDFGALPPPPTPFAERAILRPKRQTAAVLGFPGTPVAHPDRYALDVLSEITSGMGGRLFRSVRGENALAYQVTSFHRSRRDAGNFVTYTATAPENETRARDLILTECARLGAELVSASELATAKAVLVGEQVIGSQTFGSQAGELSSCAVYSLPPDEPQQYLAHIQEVDAEAVRAVAARYLQADQYWLGVVRGETEETAPTA